MKHFFKKLFGKNRKNENEISIENDMPFPIKGVDYKEVLKVKKYLENLGSGQSFAVEKRLEYTVRRITNQHFPEYKITIRQTGGFVRVFRLV